MSAPPKEAAALGRRLPIYCMAKKYQQKADSWVGFGVFAGSDGPFQYYCANHNLWAESDDVAQEAMDTLGLKMEPEDGEDHSAPGETP
jgi:hypothetical protein